MYKQCNFSMFWTAEALLECYRITGCFDYLKLGQRVLDEMLMTQASWQPSYIYVNGLGAVSYTHLDVYKRQHLRGAIRMRLSPKRTPSMRSAIKSIWTSIRTTWTSKL